MTDLFFRFAEIEYGNSTANERIVGLFRFDQGRTRGSPAHLVVAEIDSSLYAYEQLLDVINSAVEQSRALTSAMAMDPFARFEKMVQRVNEAVAAFQRNEPTPIHWNKVNIFILECGNGQLCLTGHGRLTNIFLQKTENGEMRTFDLCGSLEQPAVTDPEKAFAAIICGDMKPGDVLFMGSSNFERLRQELQIKERLSGQPPISAAMEIKKDLERQAIPDDFVAAVVSAHADDKGASALGLITPPKDTAFDSLKKLQEQGERTSRVLAPVVNPLSSFKSHSSTEAEPKVPEPLPPLKRYLNTLTDFLRRKRIKSTPATQTALRSLDAGHGTFFTTKRKILIGVGVLAVLALVVGLASWQNSRKLAAAQAAWEKSFSQAADFRNRAEGSLIYAKDSQTKTEIDQAEKILATLDTNTADHKTRIEQLNKDIGALKERLRKVVPLSGIVELYSLPVTSADGQLVAPVYTDAAAYAADNQNRQIVRVDVSTRETKTIPLPAKAGRIVSGSLGELSAVFMDDKGQFIAVLLKDQAVSLLNKASVSSTTDFVIYNKKAYVLSSAAGQIYRLVKTDAGFGKATPYLTQPSQDLGNAIGLAIDSSVYALRSDGSLLRFLSGKPDPLALTVSDPPLRAASAIWTNVDDTRILIADPAEKRVMIYDKNGLLLAQLTSADFSSLRSVTGRAGSKQAVVVSGNRLLLIPLP